jgi:hypothetical protein
VIGVTGRRQRALVREQVGGDRGAARLEGRADEAGRVLGVVPDDHDAHGAASDCRASRLVPN